MDIYLDDCADANELIEFLERAGHNVRTPRSESTSGSPDAKHLEYAASHGYALMTKNPKHFYRLHSDYKMEGGVHSGILLIYQDNILGKDMEPPDIARAIDNLLRSGLPIENEIHILNQWRWPLAINHNLIAQPME